MPKTSISIPITFIPETTVRFHGYRGLGVDNQIGFVFHFTLIAECVKVMEE